jgi:nicotinamidase/pyrazinamidase
MSIGNKLLVFLDVDTQVDFMLPSGALYVPQAEEIVPQLKDLMRCAELHHIPVISSADAHPPDDPSFAEWAPHCVVGTPGQRRIRETELGGARVVANRPGAFAPPANWSGQTVIEKTEYDVSTNPNFEAVLDSLHRWLGRPVGKVHFVVFGVATEYCVRSSALALRHRGLPVDLVTDAIQPINEEGGRKALEEMVAAGVRLTTTAEVCRSAEPTQQGTRARGK